eukprot:TRINITY_DN805_c0_g1_i1.p1 TRINITY_DN805_c0_g1~~TRINITY_DN805_c0_g1_i1.p1  ORF type:complete len:484 (-),score=74.87 TRINITY_DN805_c0_g1_i1:10-1461(-)
MRAAAVVLLVACGLLAAHAAPAEHLIKSLPGLTETIGFKQYAGYITVNATSNRNLFYWFVESQRDPATDAVVLWTNGGPGASSLTALLTEHGPFRPNPDGTTLFLNPYAWNRIASIIYLEDPAGVGFSYSDNKLDYVTNDNKTADDNYVFLTKWMLLYPEYASNPLYLTGESFAGHYIPTLGRKILETDIEHTLNVKGIVLGNPTADGDAWLPFPNPIEDGYPFITMLYTHGFLSVQTYTDTSARCGWANYLTDCANTGNYTRPSVDCLKALKKCLNYLPSNYDVEDLNAPVCLDSTPSERAQYVSSWNSLIRTVSELQESKHAASRGAFYTVQPGSVDYDPCTINYVNAYMNIPAVQTAIHVKPTQWSWFSSVLKYNPLDEFGNVVPLYDMFYKHKWTVLIYSGDFDSCVSFIGTQRWISCLGRQVVEDWRPWNIDGQHAGSVITYDGISFLTVKGSGHMVPQYTPMQAWEMWSRWIDNNGF